MPGLLNIITPPPSTRLTTLAAAKDELGITAGTDDIFIGRLIDRASAIIATHCGRTFGVQSIVETFRFGWDPGIGPAALTVAPYGTPLNVQRKPIILTALPVIAIASIVENTNPPLVFGTDYEADNVAALVWRLREGIRSFWNVPTIIATYSGGYALPNDPGRNLPADIEDVCLGLVRAGYTARGRDPAVALDWTEGLGRTQFWTRSVSAMALDEAMQARLAGHVARAW